MLPEVGISHSSGRLDVTLMSAGYDWRVRLTSGSVSDFMPPGRPNRRLTSAHCGHHLPLIVQTGSPLAATRTDLQQPLAVALMRAYKLLILSVEGGTNGVYDLPDWHTDNLLRSRLCAFISCLYRPKGGATGLHNLAPPSAHTP
jgi:hypothetical protein